MALNIGIVVEAEFLRLVLRQLLGRMAGVELAAEAASAAEAMALPHVDALIADVMPCAADPSGFAALCRRYPNRIVLIGDGDTVVRRGLTIPSGVVQVPMGTATAARDLSQLALRLQDAIGRLAAQTRLEGKPEPAPEPAAREPARNGRARRPELILIAASTGGPDALQELLGALESPVCPIVIALHIPAEHCAGLARHLATVSGHPVTVGEAGPLPDRGIVLLPGGMDHLVCMRNDGLWLRRAPAAGSVFHPNGDILLSSGAALGLAVVGIVLTGMGNDGRAGATALAAHGYPVLAQTPASCAVPGMPAAAIAAGAVREVAQPADIAHRLNGWFALKDATQCSLVEPG
jgi:two-component system, chemotaxis family, protein-glutamate methylesterase/glutaminase